MSIASISYGSLKDASNEAKDVAKKLDKYADEVSNSVYKKLNNYRGSWSSNLTTAKNKTNDKISALRTEAGRYNKYATNLIGLKEACEATDKSVKSKVSSLTATFKASYGISNNAVVNFINNCITSVRNSSAAGRWLGDGVDKFDAAKDYLKESIKEWYNYEGGKDLIKGSLVAALEITIAAIAIVTAAAAIVAGGATLLLIATLIGGVIALANGISNLANEQLAYDATQNNDPATGKRRSSINTATDWIRTDSDNRSWHNFANVVDAVDTVCSAVVVVSGGINLLKNGYKWATGSTAKLKDIKMIKNVFTKDTVKAFAGKLKTVPGNIKTVIGKGLTEIKTAIKSGNWENVTRTGKGVWNDFTYNLGKKYNDFSNEEKGIKSTKNILGVAKDLIKGDFSVGTIFKVGLFKVGLPNITVTNLPTAQGENPDSIKIGDITGIVDIYSGVKKAITSSISIFKNDSPINTDVLKKLSKPCNINISIPDLHIPGSRFDIPAVNAA